MKQNSALSKTIVALDNLSPAEVDFFLKKANGRIPTIKIGLELFCLKGIDFVKKIYDTYNLDIFLDLKLHDIPNTVKKAISSLKSVPIKFLTIHLAGGREMVSFAIEEAKISLPGTNLLGVSYLTSLGENDFLELFDCKKSDIKFRFKNLFLLAMESNIQGVVLSANELDIVKSIENQFNKKIIKVTPGIRFNDEINSNQIQDQKRVETPESAIEKGADYLVIGRPLTMANDLDKRILELSFANNH